LTDFRQKATETLNRLNKTGEAEILAVNDEARAVPLSLKVYNEINREALLNRDVTAIRRAMTQIDQGQGVCVDKVCRPIRQKLLAMKRAGLIKAPSK